MKQRIFILPLLLGPVSAMAFELDVYYDLNGNYDTFCTFPYVGSGNCPSPITSEAIAEKFMDIANNRDEVFSGFTLPDGTVLMDSTGDLKLTGRQVNAKGLDSTVTLRTTNTCAGNGIKNANGVCVDSNAMAESDKEEGRVDYATYVDWGSLTPGFNSNGVPSDFSGGETSPNDLGNNGKGGCQYYRKFKVKFHWCPETYETFTWRWANTGSVPQGYTAAEGPGLWPSGCVDGPTYDYEWKNPTDLTPGNATYKDSGGNIVNRLNVPSNFDSNWTLRGFYLLNYPTRPSGSDCQPGDHNVLGNDLPAGCIQYWGYRNTIANNLVTSNTNTWGRARLGLKKNSSGDLNYIPLNDVLENYANSRWQIWSCTEIKSTDVIHLYAGWARNPIVDTANVGGEFKIYRTGLSNPDKGDAEYRYWCQESGATLNNAGAYNASCDLGKCSLDNLPGCTTLEACTDISGAHWCFSGSTPSCMSSASGRSMCCNDNLDACTKESACTDVGGTWNGTSCVASSNSGGGNGGGTGGDISGTYKCPVNIYTPTASQHITVSGPSQSAGTCTYTVSCADGYTNLTGGNATVTCNDQQSCDALSFTGYSCTAQTPTVTCPSVATLQSGAPANITVTAGTHTTTQCKYTLTCPTNYTLNGPNSNGQITCNGSNCASVIDNYSCVAPEPTFSCPDPHDLQKPNNMTISRPTLDSSTQTCTYDLGCISGYAIPMAPPYSPSPETISCTGDQCRDGQYLQSLIDDRQNHPFTRCGKVWSTEECSATYAEGTNAAGTIRTYWNPSEYNGTMCVLTGQCDELHCEPGSLGDKYCNGTIRLCGAGAGSEAVSEDCSELVQNYKSVSCSSDCPSLDKMNSKLDPNIEHFSRFSYRYQTATECQYDVECESGYISNGQAVCDRTQGCKLNGAGWSFPTCSYDYGN